MFKGNDIILNRNVNIFIIFVSKVYLCIFVFIFCVHVYACIFEKAE